MTIEHIVMIEFKADTTEEQRAATMAELVALKDKIPGIERSRVGMNYSDRAGKIELAAVMTLTDQAALDAYGPHPEHTAAVGRFVNYVEKLTVVDFVS